MRHNQHTRQGRYLKHPKRSILCVRWFFNGWRLFQSGS
jgi:hypothetical protein